MANALRNSDWETVGKLMYESHDSLWDYFEVSCRELDLLVEFAKDIGNRKGIIGSRMTGGGFGGCTVSIVKNEYRDSIMENLTNQYRKATGIEATCFSSRPSRGAHVLKNIQPKRPAV